MNSTFQFLFTLLVFLLLCGVLSCAEEEVPNTDPPYSYQCPNTDSHWSNDKTDSDLDGIPDEFETVGFTTNNGLSFYEYGARVGKKDIFVHINYMAGWKSNPGVNPTEEMLQIIKDAFAKKDFYLHFDLGNKYHQASGISTNNFDLSDENHEIPKYDLVEVSKLYNSSLPVANYTTTRNFYQIKDDYLPCERKEFFHYMLMGYGITKGEGDDTDILGLAEFLGNDSIIAWGNFNFSGYSSVYVRNRLAYTIMHELGHNLGLRHGGGVNDNFKPNYVSAMNYLYDTGLPKPSDTGVSNFPARYYYLAKRKGRQLTNDYPHQWSDIVYGQHSTNFILNFSSGSRSNLNENSLDESFGVGTDLGGVDWNLDNQNTNSVSVDINFDNKQTTLEDYDDWANLLLNIRNFSSHNDYSPGWNNLSTPKNENDDFGNWVE